MLHASSQPPCWAVIFSAPASPADLTRRMLRLASLQAGYLGAESIQDDSGRAFTRCYWDDVDAIAAWRMHAEQLLSRAGGWEGELQFALQIDHISPPADVGSGMKK